jgi:carboxylate-amine ligase
LNDAIAIAALYRAAVKYLCLDEGHYQDFDAVDRAMAVENKWRAQRYGIHATFVTRSGSVTVMQMLRRLLFLVSGQCSSDCEAELEHCCSIVRRGTSADIQSSIFDESCRYGAEFALRRAADWVRRSTASECAGVARTGAPSAEVEFFAVRANHRPRRKAGVPSA